MNISYNWLKDLIDIKLTAEDTAKALTRVGLAVEGIETHGDDLILDIDLTSNRSDCLSHLGIARELGVITGKPLAEGSQQKPDIENDLPGVADIPFPSILAPDIVKVDAQDLCQRFTARIIRNVKIGPSPEWLVKRLEAIGERSINNVADITNYVMHELGQPMHAFDLDKLKEKRIVVRRAQSGESITTLDEVDRKLDETILSICDAEKPVAVAGVMGGFDSGISESTTNVILEAAFFKRENIRQTSRKLGLSTEASYRFERGIDINNIKAASERATALILDLAGGEAGEFIDIYPEPINPNIVTSPDLTRSVARLTGLSIPKDRCIEILRLLGIREAESLSDAFRLADDSTSIAFSSPSWRHDIAIEEDLVEEIARHHGYENIAQELPPAFGAGEYQVMEPAKRRLRQTLTGLGFDEAISYSFIDSKFDRTFGLQVNGTEQEYVTLQDSVIEGAVRMRPSLIPGLLDALRLNLNHQRRDVSLFEIGKVFYSSDGEGSLPLEREFFAIAITGREVLQKRVEPVRPLDFYDAKGSLEAAFEALGISSCEFRMEKISGLREGQSAKVYVDGGEVGYIGRLNEEISATNKFRSPVYIAEIDVESVLSRNFSQPVYRPLHRFPAVTRDVTFLIKDGLSFDDIRAAVIDQEITICRNVGFVDIFKDQQADSPISALTMRFEYRSDERTLVEEEVNAAHESILNSLRDTLGIEPRK